MRPRRLIVSAYLALSGCAPVPEAERAPLEASGSATASSAAPDAPASPSAPASSDATATASSAAAAEPRAGETVSPDTPRLLELDPKRCLLPSVRPPDLTIRFLRVVLPIHGERRREGVELHAEVACPATGGPRATLDRLPCKHLSAAELDQVYGELRRAGFSTLESDKSGTSRSPHYGSRTLELVFGAQRCSFSDTSSQPVAAGSEKRFFQMIDAVTSR